MTAPDVSAKPDTLRERLEKAIYDNWRNAPEDSPSAHNDRVGIAAALEPLVRSLIAEQRLEEAEWWRDNYAGRLHGHGEPYPGCKACERLANLKAQAIK